MNSIQTVRERNIRFKAVFALSVIISLTLAVFLGLRLNCFEKCIILPRSPFDEGDLFGGIASICFYDMLLFWLISIPLARPLRICLSALLYFQRGIVIGNACGLLFENSVSAVAVLILLSYITVTFLALVYDAFLNGTGEKSSAVRFFCCLVVTGAAAFIRILPILHLDK